MAYFSQSDAVAAVATIIDADLQGRRDQLAARRLEAQRLEAHGRFWRTVAATQAADALVARVGGKA